MNVVIGAMKRVTGPCVVPIVLGAILLVGTLTSYVNGQIDVNEMNLNSGESAFGIETLSPPPPYVNSQDISLWAWGSTDPLLYHNCSFYAYGLYCDVNMVNTGIIDVNAIGGNAGSNTVDTYAYTIATGIRSGVDVNNTGNLNITVTGGTAHADPNAHAYTRAFGIDSDGDVNHTGDINVTVTGGTVTTNEFGYAFAYAQGIEAGGTTTIAGILNVAATGGIIDTNDSGNSNAYVEGIHSTGHANNTASLFVTATGGTTNANIEAYARAYSYGIYMDSGDTKNNGSITSVVTGGVANSNDRAFAYVWGRAIFSGGGNYVNNSGVLTVTATGGTANTYTDNYADSRAHAFAYGIDANSDVFNSSSIKATALGGTVTAYADAHAYAKAYGIYCSGIANNSGTLNVMAHGGMADAYDIVRAYAYAYGIEANRDVNNLGALHITSTAGSVDANDIGYAYAYAYGIKTDKNIYNTGMLNVAANGGTADSNNIVYANAYAYGVEAGGNVDNTGTLIVTATGGTGNANSTNTDAHAYGIHASGTVANSANIIVKAIAGNALDAEAYTYGIYMSGDATLTNTGIIRPYGDHAYEVFVASGTTTFADFYNITLDGDPNKASMHVADGAALNLNNATLTVTRVDKETRWDTNYQLFEIEGTGAVDGRFSQTQTFHPSTTAVYNTQGTDDAADDTVALRYTPHASENFGSIAVKNQMVSQSIDIVQRHMTKTLLNCILVPGVSGFLVDAGSVERSMALTQPSRRKNSGMFVEPYYSTMKRQADPLGFDGKLRGLSVGYERTINNTLITLHGGYGLADVDYTGTGYSNNSDEQDIITAGVSALTWKNDWTFRYSLSGVYGSREYSGVTGLALDETEKASTKSYGAHASAMAGHVVRLGSYDLLLPEVGLAYLWGHNNAYTTEASDPNWNSTYSAVNDHDIHAQATLHWLSNYVYDDIQVVPSALIGVRHLLTAAQSTVNQSLSGANPASVNFERERMALTLAGSVTLKMDQHTLSLTYAGEYAPDAKRHNYWLRYGWQF